MWYEVLGTFAVLREDVDDEGNSDTRWVELNDLLQHVAKTDVKRVIAAYEKEAAAASKAMCRVSGADETDPVV